MDSNTFAANQRFTHACNIQTHNIICGINYISHEAHENSIFSIGLQLDILNVNLSHGHCYKKLFFSQFLPVRSFSFTRLVPLSSFPLFALDLFSLVFLYDYKVLVCKYFGLCVFQKDMQNSDGYCGLSFLFSLHPSNPFHSDSLSHICTCTGSIHTLDTWLSLMT